MWEAKNMGEGNGGQWFQRSGARSSACSVALLFGFIIRQGGTFAGVWLRAHILDRVMCVGTRANRTLLLMDIQPM
jgi:hypothetical protein